MKNTKKTTIAIIAAILVALTVIMTGCSTKSKETPAQDQLVLDALLDPKMVYSDDRFSFGEDAYKIVTDYMRKTEPVKDLGCCKWQLPAGYVLEVREDRSAYLTTFPIGGRKTDDDPSVYETRLLWTNIDTGHNENVDRSRYAVQVGINATFAIDYVSKDTYEIVVWELGEKVAKLPIDNVVSTCGFVDSYKQGYFYYGSDNDEFYEGGKYKGVFFENGNELYFCYEINGEYKAKLLADDYTGTFGAAASSIFYIDEQANVVQLDVYDKMERIEKSIIGINAYGLTAYYGDVTWRQLGSNKVFTPEYYVLVNEKVPFGWGA